MIGQPKQGLTLGNGKQLPGLLPFPVSRQHGWCIRVAADQKSHHLAGVFGAIEAHHFFVELLRLGGGYADGVYADKARSSGTHLIE